jgi:LacI family transcriptional regulator
MASRQIRIPDSIAIVGYDDIGFAVAAVPLISVRQRRHQRGRVSRTWAAEAALDGEAVQ